MGKKLYSLAVEIAQAKEHAAGLNRGLEFDQRDKVRLGFAYLALERWHDALSVLENLGEVSIVMQSDGPWGDAWTPFVPAGKAALCREKLGLPASMPADHFTFGNKACLCLHTPSAFTASADGLWIGAGGDLLQLGFDLHTNKVVRLQVSPQTPITV